MNIRQWVLAGLLILLVSGNVGFLAYARSNPEPTLVAPGEATSESVLYAQSLDPNQIMVGTRDNVLIGFQDQVEYARANFPGSLRALASAPGSVVAGGSDGSIVIYDSHLQELHQLSVEGQVTAIASSEDGSFVVVHGPGGYANSATLSSFDHEAMELLSIEVPFNVTALAVTDDTIIIGTLNSRVQSFSRTSGSVLWTTTLGQPIVFLSPSRDGSEVLVGDSDGGATLLDLAGEPGLRKVLGSAPVRTAGQGEGSTSWLIGDGNGSVHAIDTRSNAIHGTQLTDGDIALVAEMDAGRFIVVPRDGQWVVFDGEGIASAQSATRIRNAWLAFNLVAGAGVVAAGLVQSERARHRLKAVRRAMWRSRWAYMFILPSLLLIAVFTYYPTVMSVYYSFTNFSLRNETQFVGLSNYTTILRDDFYFRTGISNMLIMTVAGIIKTLTMPLLAAELVYWLRNTRHQYLFRTLFVLPAVVPDLVFALLWRQVYDPNTGLLNRLLDLVGLEQLQRGWLGQDSTALWAVIWVGFPFISAFAFLIYLGGLLNINADYFDAAKIDGASVASRFRNIDVPLLIPQFRIMLFFAFAGTVQGFASIFILTGGGPGFATYVPALQMYLRIADGDFGYASAIGVILFAIVCVATYFVLHFRKQSIENA